MEYKRVKDFGRIDLNRHALIEASAGTGKTYTIENLVIRLLKEKNDITLENILIVTFTEKATCELKIRIQEKLEEELEIYNDPEKKESDDAEYSKKKEKLKEALDSFDLASIYTIHGFCQTVLSEFSFENKTLFQKEIIDDNSLYESFLKEQMRSDWQKKYGEILPDLIEMINFNNFFSVVTDIAKNYSSDSGDLLIPDLKGKSLHEITQHIKEKIADFSKIGGLTSFSENYNKLNIHKKSKELRINRIIKPLEKYFGNLDDSNINIFNFLNLLSNINEVKSSGITGIKCLLPEKWNGNKNNIEECPDLEIIVKNLSEIIKLREPLLFTLTIETIKKLREDVDEEKLRNGWLSFNDMLILVESATSGPGSAGLLKKLREKYKIAFVDEFQDTDIIQWNIFRKIFLTNPERENKSLLFLIGDPKQAIYSFRGADVFTYLEARKKMENLALDNMANLYTLATNWRSQPELIQSFNKLFSAKSWFVTKEESSDFDICYRDVSFPKSSKLPEKISRDNSHRPSLNIIDLTIGESAKKAKVILARFIIKEIKYLINQCDIEIKKKGKAFSKRKPDYGDISILVRGKSDMAILEPLLTKNSIPYTYYKKPGLFQSEEALFLSILFHAVLDPGNITNVKKALLTPFFNFKPTDLFNYESQVSTHPLKQIFYKWNEYAITGKWSSLFNSLMEESGLIFRETSSQNWERKETNYQQIFEHLETVSYNKNLDFRSLTALLDSYRKESKGVEDGADLHQIETEDRKVQIMTMHVSKGLQFPFVFIAGGLTQPFADKYFQYHCFDGNSPGSNIKKVFDLSKSDDGKDLHNMEKTSEDKRLFYVALTRAQYKLYLPFYKAEKKQRYHGPVSGFVAESIEETFNRCEECENVLWITPSSFNFSDKKSDEKERGEINFKPKYHEEDMFSPRSQLIYSSKKILPKTGYYQHRKTSLESFSSIHRNKSYKEKQFQETGFQSAEEIIRDSDEPKELNEKQLLSMEATEAQIPGGTETGSMFHDILEFINYEKVIENPEKILEIEETRELIEKNMVKYKMDEKWREKISEIISKVLTSPVTVFDNSFTLGSISPADRLHEPEFYFPFQVSNKFFNKSDDFKFNNSDGYIKGFIDLIFRVNGKFYIADWKSNRLDSGYDYESMHKSMNDADYHLQYKIYTFAVLRWLKKIMGDKFNPDLFGGIFYFYIRGMDGNSDNGIYYVKPSFSEDMAELENEIISAASS